MVARPMMEQLLRNIVADDKATARRGQKIRFETVG
jgi:hypothetical protein